MLASSTIISTNGLLLAASRLLELGDDFFLVHIGQREGKAVGGGFEVAKIGQFSNRAPVCVDCTANCSVLRIRNNIHNRERRIGSTVFRWRLSVPLCLRKDTGKPSLGLNTVIILKTESHKECAMKHAKTIALGLFVFLTTIAWTQEPARQRGTFVTIDMPDASTSNPPGSFALKGTTVDGLNNAGQVIGYYNAASTGVTHGFLRERHGKIVLIDDPDAGTYINTSLATLAGTTPYGISNAGVIAGVYVDANGTGNGFLEGRSGTFDNFHAPGANTNYQLETQAFAINRKEAVAGVYSDVNNLAHGFVREPDGTITGFEAPDAATSGFFEGTWAVAINDSGEITGWYHDASLVAHTFFRAKDGTITDFEVPGAAAIPYLGTYASSIDDEGTVIGFYYDAKYGIHNFLRKPDGKIVTVHIPGEEAYLGVEVVSINRRGAMLGIYIDANNGYHTFIRLRDGSIVYLNDPDAGTGASQGTAGVSLNDDGDVAGYFVDTNNVDHGFLWTHSER